MKRNEPMTYQILLVESDLALRDFWTQAFQKEGFQILFAEDELQARQKVRASAPDLIFLGSNMEGTKGVRLMTELKSEQGNLLVAAPLNTPILRQELKAAQAHGGTSLRIEVGRVVFAVKEALNLRAQVEPEFPELVGSSPAMKKIKETLAQLLQVETTTLLLQGETGTGKELIAQILHRYGNRRSKPFITLNCTHIPEALFESELFGHERGAFTDAKKPKAGLLELADGGTLFLDEIGDMPPGIQAKFLTVLEQKRFRHLGGKEEFTSNVRIICATNQDLAALIEKGRFREDLYHRICVFPMTLPPLRDRMKDLLPIAGHYIHLFSKEFRKEIQGLTPSAELALRNYAWPGNVRELKNVIERAVILEEGCYLTPASLMLNADRHDTSGVRQASFFLGDLSIHQMEKKVIEAALQRAGGNQTEAARLLGITRFALRNRLKKYQLSP